jgi:hypothetical protein
MVLIPLAIEKCIFACWFSTTPSHLTCTPTKSNLYFDISLATVIREPALYRLLTFHVPNRSSVFHSLGHLFKESAQVRGPFWHFVTNLFFYGEELLAPRQSWRTTPCRLSATAYSVYSQLPSISGGHLLHPQPEDTPCRGDKGPT